MKHGIKAALAALAFALALGACENPAAEPASPDLGLYREVNNSGKKPGSANEIDDFFPTFSASPLPSFNLGAGKNYIDITLNGSIFKDANQAVEAVKASFEFSRLEPVPAGSHSTTPYPYAANKGITVKSVELRPGGATIRITLDLEPTVGDVIELRVNAAKLEGGRGEKIDTNGNLIAGEPADDVYYNLGTGSSVSLGGGVTRNPQWISSTTSFLGNPGISFTKTGAAYEVKAAVTWATAASPPQGGLDTDGYIKSSLDKHLKLEKYRAEGKTGVWEAVPGGGWVVVNGAATFTAAAADPGFGIYRLNLTDRPNLETEKEYYGFKQKLNPVIWSMSQYNPNEEELVSPVIPLSSFSGEFFPATMLPTSSLTVNFIDNKGGWIDLRLGTLDGIDAATLVPANFRLYAASSNVLSPPGTLITPLRGIPVDSVSW
jgi:hypothetical protein